METRKIKTLVKNYHHLGNSEYVIGRIMGAMAAMCKEDPATGLEFGFDYCYYGHILVTETTVERYDAFADVIENWYPDLCVFNYVEEIEKAES